MSKKLLSMLRMITKDFRDEEFYSDEMIESLSYDSPDLFTLGEELAVLESQASVEDDELDILKSLLVYILIRKSSFEKEDIYSFIFGGGRKITWN